MFAARFFSAAVLIALVLVEAAQAQNRYAIIHIENATKDITIHYRVRWGTGDWGDEVTMKPGDYWDHWYTYERLNQNSSPTPQVKFASGIGRTRTQMLYDLQAYASPEKTSGGKVYRFEKRI